MLFRSGLVALRSRRDGDLGAVPLESLLQAAEQAVRQRLSGLQLPAGSNLTSSAVAP